MADFVSKTVTKSDERILTTPFASQAAFNTVIEDIIIDNPWGCTTYESGGVTIPAQSKSSEYYSGTIVYENNDGKKVGEISIRAPTSGAFDKNISIILANTAIESAMGGTGSNDNSDDGFNVILKCHDPNGELYNVTFKRTKVALSSYNAASILSTIETWADTIPALA